MKFILILLGICFVYGANLRREEEVSFMQTGVIIHKQAPITVEIHRDPNFAIALQKHASTHGKSSHKHHHHSKSHKHGKKLGLKKEISEFLHEGIQKIDHAFKSGPSVSSFLETQQITQNIILQEIETTHEEIIPDLALDVGQYEDYAENKSDFQPVYSEEAGQTDMPADVVEAQYTYSNNEQVAEQTNNIPTSNEVSPLPDQSEETLKVDDMPLFGDQMMPEEVQYEKEVKQQEDVQQNINDSSFENTQIQDQVVTYDGHDDTLQW